MYETVKKEKALLVMVEIGPPLWPVEVLAEEFKSLVISTGLEVEELVSVRRAKPVPSVYIGKGKLQELCLLVEEAGVDVVIFNNNLTSTQQRNLEDRLGVKTIDRTQLILDIFAARAATQEGILQVELAQLEYLLPRLKGKGIALSRLGGGIGTRGPGEKKLEVDRRRINERITRLRQKLAGVRMQREVMRKKRQRQKVAVCSLVGYTNAGKTTLFNALTQSEERVSGNLFTTLDTISHTFTLPHKLKPLLTDTVGFIYDLPPHLVAAFKATLEELHYADLLIQVVDAASVDIHRLMKAVAVCLEELGLSAKPLLLVLNKIDGLREAERKKLARDYPDAVLLSAREGRNLEELKKAIYQYCFSDSQEAILRFPFSQMAMVKEIHACCEVLKTDYQNSDVLCWVKAKQSYLESWQKKGIQVKKLTP